MLCRRFFMPPAGRLAYLYSGLGWGQYGAFGLATGSADREGHPGRVMAAISSDI